MWAYNYMEMDDELYHYGVVGMKWGVHRALRKKSQNQNLQRKALSLDKKAARLTAKSEKAHSKYDLGSANKKAVKAARYDRKAAKVELKALKTDNDLQKAYYNQKAGKLKYRAAKKRIEGNAISKTKGYGIRAMKYSIKSDVVAKKAAKARMKIENNKYYIEKMNKKVSAISKEDLAGAYSFVNKLTNN